MTAIISLGMLLFVFNTVSALELNYPLLCPGPGPCDPSAPDFIAWLYKFALGSVGALAVLVIAWGGIKYITSQGNSSLQSDAKEWIWGAILGLALLVGSFLILVTINPDLVRLGVINLNLNPDPGTDLYRVCIFNKKDDPTFPSCGLGVSALTCAVQSCGCRVDQFQATPRKCSETQTSPSGNIFVLPACNVDEICVLLKDDTSSTPYYRLCCDAP